METTLSNANPLVILNPAANRGDMGVYRTLVRQQTQVHHGTYVETRWSGEAQVLAEQAAREGRALVVVGGDGTVHEVVNGLLMAERRVPLGIVAAGSGNDFAWNALRLPHDPVSAIERAFTGDLLDVDAGMVNGRYFANGFSVGLDADIGAATNKMKRIPFLRGTALYYAAACRQLLFGYHRCPWLTLTIDGISIQQEMRYTLIAATNGPSYGAGFRINPNADHRDGLLEICAVDYVPLLRVLRLFPGVKQGQHVNEPEVTFYRAKTLLIESRHPVMLQADGETMLATRVEAHILPGALTVRV